MLLDVQCHKLEAVLIFGNVQFTTQAVHELMEHGIELAILTRTGRLVGQLTSPSTKNDPRGGITQESVVVVPANSLNGSGVVVAAKGNDYFSYPPRSWGYSSPAWSPDGSTIACAYTEYDSSFNMTSNIVLANSDGSGNIRKITSVPQNAAATSADFSPDGQWIVYSVVTSKSTVLNISDFMSYNITSDIYKKNLSTGEEVRLTNDGSSSEPSWGTAVAQPKIPTGTTTIPGGGTTTIPGRFKMPVC